MDYFGETSGGRAHGWGLAEYQDGSWCLRWGAVGTGGEGEWEHGLLLLFDRKRRQLLLFPFMTGRLPSTYTIRGWVPGPKGGRRGGGLGGSVGRWCYRGGHDITSLRC